MLVTSINELKFSKLNSNVVPGYNSALRHKGIMGSEATYPRFICLWIGCGLPWKFSPVAIKSV